VNDAKGRKIMNKILRVIVLLPAILFIGIGIRWLVDPQGAAAALGMPLLDGIGRSSQIGDVGGFFLVTGIMVVLGVITGKRVWFQAPALLLMTIAIFRILAWLLHDAALATSMIAVEVVLAVLFVFASARLTKD
jgi:hypothetical protein|tara:strand:+ start:4830 stop:5231 length:402 start_codon:yes stop_codon:yes gene_type:complete